MGMPETDKTLILLKKYLLVIFYPEVHFMLFFTYFFAHKKIFSTNLSTENVRNITFALKISKL
jgi:hypothetical protein